jgi:formaldehyde-activating enzyme involved in methanogenesis
MVMEWLCFNWLSLLSIVIAVAVPFILYLLKPNLEIKELTLDTLNNEPCIKVKVINQQCCFDAINVNIEMCVIEARNTYHFEIDKSDFLIIPHNENKEKDNEEKDDNYRNFKAINLYKTTREAYWKNKDFSSFIEEKVKIQNAIVRVRVYATHEYSGFGRAFKQKFIYDVKTDLFSLMERKDQTKRKRFIPVSKATEQGD